MIAAVLLALPLAGPAAAQDVPPGVSAAYRCAGGAVLPVAYLNPAGGPSLAVVAWAGRLVPMEAGSTGSGVRYVALDPKGAFVWHSKGDAGTLLALGPDGAETVVLEDCARLDG